MGKEKDIALAKPVHNVDIQRVDELVAVYINGEKKERAQAQKEILEYFNEYLEKYVNLFAGAQVDLNNYDTKGFLAMFLTGRPKTLSNLALQRSYIANVMSRFTRDDIKNELVVLFLGVLSKYRIYPGVNALNPLTKFFRYRTKDWFNRTVKDALFKVVDVEQFGGGGDDSKGKLTLEGWLDVLDPVHVDFEDGLSQFDISWVRNPPQKMYKSLTTYERYLLFLTFNQDLTVIQIADKLERDKDTIKRHLTAILEKVGGLYKDGSE
jgi:hypothetical protein